MYGMNRKQSICREKFSKFKMHNIIYFVNALYIFMLSFILFRKGSCWEPFFRRPNREVIDLSGDRIDIGEHLMSGSLGCSGMGDCSGECMPRWRRPWPFRLRLLLLRLLLFVRGLSPPKKMSLFVRVLMTGDEVSSPKKFAAEACSMNSASFRGAFKFQFAAKACSMNVASIWGVSHTITLSSAVRSNRRFSTMCTVSMIFANVTRRARFLPLALLLFFFLRLLVLLEVESFSIELYMMFVSVAANAPVR
jgi:hypothetical protein